MSDRETSNSQETVENYNTPLHYALMGSVAVPGLILAVPNAVEVAKTTHTDFGHSGFMPTISIDSHAHLSNPVNYADSQVASGMSYLLLAVAGATIFRRAHRIAQPIGRFLKHMHVEREVKKFQTQLDGVDEEIVKSFVTELNDLYTTAKDVNN
jgi:hypothetical protein